MPLLVEFMQAQAMELLLRALVSEQRCSQASAEAGKRITIDHIERRIARVNR
jgi:hypothetical protein